MKRFLTVLLLASSLAGSRDSNPAQRNQTPKKPSRYLGFDRNVYPGAEAISILRKTFVFTSYWLSPPPGEKTNTWTGKREFLQSRGYGFLLLYRGRESQDFTNPVDAKRTGTRDGSEASAAAKAEGFARGAILFLDIEAGGRLPDLYHAYLGAWIEQIVRGGFRAGVYCSGIPVQEGPGMSISTADDIRDRGFAGGVTFWVYNDVCPTSLGCKFPEFPPSPSQSGVSYAAVWQYAQSPRRKEFTRQCAATYSADGNCYAPVDLARHWFLDVNCAESADPSRGRRIKGNVIPEREPLGITGRSSNEGLRVD
jgi:hypothetical protein